MFRVKFRKFQRYLLFPHEEKAVTRPTTAAFMQIICDRVIAFLSLITHLITFPLWICLQIYGIERKIPEKA